jgi:N-acetylated-alpha-linked acidic dipeptidase
MRTETHDRNLAIDRKAFEATAPPGEVRVAPPRRDPVPFLNFAPLQNAVAHVREAARAYDATALSGASAPREALRGTNAILRRAEQALLREEGLPGRPWFKHFVYAPGLYTGYGVKTLPAAREAIEQRDWPGAERGIAVTAQALEAFAGEVDRAAAALRSGAGR